MGKSKLKQYKGRLDASEIAQGINAAMVNARRLAGDAAILLKEKRYPSAVTLAILSIEESGKASILRELALTKNRDETREVWKSYRSHTKKNSMWILPEMVAKGARKLEDFREMVDDESEHMFVLERLKQVGFYTDCLSKGQWSLPEQVIDSEFAEGIVGIAALSARDREVTTREIDLWIKHLKPVWSGEISLMKQALHSWFVEMQEEGLMEKNKSIDDFIW